MDQIKNIIAITFILTSIHSCKSVTGTYEYFYGKGTTESILLKIKKNFTFTYEGWSDILGPHTIEGQWNLSGDTVFLREEEKVQTEKVISIKTNKSFSTDKNIIKILNQEDSSEIAGVSVFFNNSDSAIFSNLNGEVIFNKSQSIDSLRIKYFNFEQSTILNEEQKQGIDIYLNLDHIKIKPFKFYEKWIFSGRKITPLDSKNKKMPAISLKKR